MVEKLYIFICILLRSLFPFLLPFPAHNYIATKLLFGGTNELPKLRDGSLKKDEIWFQTKIDRNCLTGTGGTEVVLNKDHVGTVGTEAYYVISLPSHNFPHTDEMIYSDHSISNTISDLKIRTSLRRFEKPRRFAR